MVLGRGSLYGMVWVGSIDSVTSELRPEENEAESPVDIWRKSTLIKETASIKP